jgi:hypothetical protein
MVFSFSESSIERIASVLGVSPAWEDDLARFELSDEESGRQLALEIPDAPDSRSCPPSW